MGVSMSASGPGQISSLPLLDVREELVHVPSQADASQAGVPIYGPSKCQWPSNANNGGTPELNQFWPATAGVGIVNFNGGLHVRRFNRTVAAVNVRSQQLQFPLAFRPVTAGIPVPARYGRRYLWEWVMWRDALVAASVFGGGVASLSGTASAIPNIGATNFMGYYFRSLQGENGDLWTVGYRPNYTPGALTLVNTPFSVTVPRFFSMDFQENWNGDGASLTMQIDGQTVATFNDAQLTPPGVTNGAFWGLSVGSEGAAAGTFDYQYGARFRMFTVGGADF